MPEHITTGWAGPFLMQLGSSPRVSVLSTALPDSELMSQRPSSTLRPQPSDSSSTVEPASVP